MKRTPATRRLLGSFLTGIILTLALLLAACGGASTSANPTAPPTLEPASTITATQAAPSPQTGTSVPPTATASPPTPTATAQPTAVPSSTLFLELLAPADGTGVEIDVVRVMGKTRIDAAVGINGIPVVVSADGSFRYDLNLETGVNLVEVVANTLSGESAYRDAAVFFISTAAGLPFTLFYPPDGLMVSVPEIPVFGGTSPEAVVGVNGTPVDINSLGIFSTLVTLEEGGNFIEVLATDIDGNVRFQTVAVFYLP